MLMDFHVGRQKKDDTLHHSQVLYSKSGVENNITSSFPNTHLHRHESSRGVKSAHLPVLLICTPLGQAIPVIL